MEEKSGGVGAFVKKKKKMCFYLTRGRKGEGRHVLRLSKEKAFGRPQWKKREKERKGGK